jgi:transposase
VLCFRYRAWDEQGREALEGDLRLLAALEEEVARQDQLLAQQGYSDPRVKLLMTLPGVDPTVAQTLLAALGNATRFADSDHATSYLGPVLRTRQSASRCYHGPITKCGSGHARAMLVEAAQHVGARLGPLGVFFRRLARPAEDVQLRRHHPLYVKVVGPPALKPSRLNDLFNSADLARLQPDLDAVRVE